ncbi:MAG: ABC transporter ATP-binding protein [Armatimonadota bacterium]|nr:ABC transporter ATP-binding protein [Armatimonadota bacterium]
MAEAIVLQNVTKVFELPCEQQTSLKAAVLSFRRPSVRRLVALENVTLSIQRGETVAIIGRNGSGKSTLLRVICRVYRQTKGTVNVNGRISTLLDLGAGIEPELTGRENVYFNGAIMGLTTKEIQTKFDRIVSFAELDKFIDAPAKTYSNGMLLRLGFSVAIETDPDILLVDEVLAVGDAAFQQKCYSRIREFQKSGGTIIVVTHNLDVAVDIATRTVWLDGGVVRADGSPSETVREYLKAAHVNQEE